MIDKYLLYFNSNNNNNSFGYNFCFFNNNNFYIKQNNCYGSTYYIFKIDLNFFITSCLNFF